MSSPDSIPLTFTTSDGVTHVNRSAANLQAGGIADAVILPPYVAALKTLVDKAAESLRNTVVTPGSGQAMEYEEARAQAVAALAAQGSVTASDYPMLAATVGIDVDPSTGKPATDVLGVARAVMAAYAAWTTVGAAIRGVRIQAKAALDAATTVAAVTAAYTAIAWPSTTSTPATPSA